MSTAEYKPLSGSDPEEENQENDPEKHSAIIDSSPEGNGKSSKTPCSKIKQCLGKTGYPHSVWFILGNEFCERFSYYGMHAILVIYLTKSLKMDDDSATAVYHAFNMFCYFSPIFGAILADSCFGKYRTILYVSIIYAIGNIVVAITAIPKVQQEVELAGPMIGLLLIAIGTGGIKPCVSAFGGDQFAPGQERLLQSFFSIFYFAINLGSLLSMLITPLLRSDVQCFGNDCYFLAFGVPAILMLIALAFFWCGRKGYKMYAPSGNVVVEVFKTCTYAAKQKFANKKIKKGHWLDWAEDKYGVDKVKDIKILFKVLVMLLPMPVFWTLFDQQGSRWTLQAQEMDGNLGALGALKPDQVQALNPVLILILIPVFETCIYPLLRRINVAHKPLQRMCCGMLLASISFILAAMVQIWILNTSIKIEPPKDGEANLQIINGASCPIQVTGPNSINVKIPFREDIEHMSIPASVDFVKVETVDCPLSLKNTFTLKLTEHKSYTLAIGQYKGALIGDQLTDVTKVKHAGHTMVRLIYLGGNVGQKVTISLNKTMSFKGLTNFAQMEYHDITADHYKIRVIDEASGKTILQKPVYFGNGGIYTVVVQPNPEKSNELFLNTFIEVKAKAISMLWQIPQYVCITCGEVLFSITGLEFAYSQSPASMKSCIMAAWLLTVSVGNLIVVIFAEYRVTQNMAYEFLFFAAMLAVTMVVFMVMSYYYVYTDLEDTLPRTTEVVKADEEEEKEKAPDTDDTSSS